MQHCWQGRQPVVVSQLHTRAAAWVRKEGDQGRRDGLCHVGGRHAVWTSQLISEEM